jgi:hypothetical protein
MNILKIGICALLTGAFFQACTPAKQDTNQVSTEGSRAIWTQEKANDWYAQQGWLVGADFLPSTAINQLEMFQEATFDTATIDKELGWAAGIGMNTMRVYLHDLLWEQDSTGFTNRLDVFWIFLLSIK